LISWPQVEPPAQQRSSGERVGSRGVLSIIIDVIGNNKIVGALFSLTFVPLVIRADAMSPARC
jgi:hypothetical protein